MRSERVRTEAIEFTRQVAKLGLLSRAAATPNEYRADRQGAGVRQGEGRAGAPQFLPEPPSP